jgi:hypothetical protein
MPTLSQKARKDGPPARVPTYLLIYLLIYLAGTRSNLPELSV